MKRVLFIGNSFTYFNEMPAMFEDVANDAGFDVHAVSVVKGGWYLRGYADPADSMGQALRSAYPRQKWDYIVLQEQSFNPAGNKEDFLQAVRNLRALMPEGRFLFYQTWAYEDGTAKLAATGMTYDEMCRGLRDAYLEAAREHDGICVPVGDGFALAHERRPQLCLYQADSFHPNMAGSYLAALLFIGKLSGMNVQHLMTVKKLDESKAQYLRDLAQELLDR